LSIFQGKKKKRKNEKVDRIVEKREKERSIKKKNYKKKEYKYIYK